MSEFRDAVKLANRVLSDEGRDPDDDMTVLARQFLRQCERSQRAEKSLLEMHDPYADLIQANRDALLDMHKEAMRRVCKALGEGDAGLAFEVVDALNKFHPMHGESWAGWPKENQE